METKFFNAIKDKTAVRLLVRREDGADNMTHDGADNGALEAAALAAATKVEQKVSSPRAATVEGEAASPASRQSLGTRESRARKSRSSTRCYRPAHHTEQATYLANQKAGEAAMQESRWLLPPTTLGC